MALTKEKKREVENKVREIADSSRSLVFVNFHALKVSEARELRGELRGQEVGYYVAKKTLIKRALADQGYEGELPDLEGECALAYSTDLLAPAREIYRFHKSHPEHLSIMGGVFDGRYMSKEEMEEIASIPGREVLIGQFVNLINSPIQQFVTALDRVAEQKTT